MVICNIAYNRKGILSSPVRYIIQVDTSTSFASPIIVDTLTELLKFSRDGG